MFLNIALNQAPVLCVAIQFRPTSTDAKSADFSDLRLEKKI